MTDQPTSAPVWQDGDPTMEAIAAAVWEHCEKQHGSGIVIDDPRNIAAAAVAGIRDTARTASGQQPEPTVAPPADDLPDRLRDVLTERFTELGNPFSEMRIQFKGPDGWPATKPVGADLVAETLRELLAAGPAEETHVVTDDSDDPEHIDDCPGCDHPFLIDGCTCIPWTRQDGPPRYLNRPTDTVDMISGYERGRDCPHHAPAVGQPAEAQATAEARARLAVLREAAEAAEGELLQDDTGTPEDEAYNQGVRDAVAAIIRRMAEEARS